jgi:hypothetical protein
MKVSYFIILMAVVDRPTVERSPTSISRHVGTRGNNYKQEKMTAKIDQRQRIFNNWNGLPSEVVNAPTQNTSKNRLDKKLRGSDSFRLPEPYQWDHQPSN